MPAYAYRPKLGKPRLHILVVTGSAADATKARKNKRVRRLKPIAPKLFELVGEGGVVGKVDKFASRAGLVKHMKSLGFKEVA